MCCEKMMPRQGSILGRRPKQESCAGIEKCRADESETQECIEDCRLDVARPRLDRTALSMSGRFCSDVTSQRNGTAAEPSLHNACAPDVQQCQAPVQTADGPQWLRQRCQLPRHSRHVKFPHQTAQVQKNCQRAQRSASSRIRMSSIHALTNSAVHSHASSD